MRKLFTLMCLTLFVTTLTACNTMRGAGEDVEAAGEEIQEGAEN